MKVAIYQPSSLFTRINWFWDRLFFLFCLSTFLPLLYLFVCLWLETCKLLCKYTGHSSHIFLSLFFFLENHFQWHQTSWPFTLELNPVTLDDSSQGSCFKTLVMIVLYFPWISYESCEFITKDEIHFPKTVNLHTHPPPCQWPCWKGLGTSIEPSKPASMFSGQICTVDCVIYMFVLKSLNSTLETSKFKAEWVHYLNFSMKRRKWTFLLPSPI